MIFVPALLELVPELKGRTSKRERKTLQVLQILSSVTLTVNQVINCLKLSTCSQTMLHSCLCISLYFCADRYLKKMIKKSTFLLDKYKLEYPEILANWEHSFEHWYWLVKDLQGYSLKNLIKEMASDENKMGEEVKEKKDARPCGRLAKVILTGFWFLPGKVLNLPLSGGEAGDANKGRPVAGHHL